MSYIILGGRYLRSPPALRWPAGGGVDPRMLGRSGLAQLQLPCCLTCCSTMALVARQRRMAKPNPWTAAQAGMPPALVFLGNDVERAARHSDHHMRPLRVFPALDLIPGPHCLLLPPIPAVRPFLGPCYHRFWRRVIGTRRVAALAGPKRSRTDNAQGFSGDAAANEAICTDTCP